MKRSGMVERHPLFKLLSDYDGVNSTKYQHSRQQVSIECSNPGGRAATRELINNGIVIDPRVQLFTSQGIQQINLGVKARVSQTPGCSYTDEIMK